MGSKSELTLDLVRYWEPLNSHGPISTVASLHLDMSLPNCYAQELFLNSIDEYDEVLKRYPPSELVPVESEPYLDFF